MCSKVQAQRALWFWSGGVKKNPVRMTVSQQPSYSFPESIYKSRGSGRPCGSHCLGFLWWALTDKHKDTAPGPESRIISLRALDRFARNMPFFTTSLIYRTRINWNSCACIYRDPFTTEFISDSGHYFTRICLTRRLQKRLHNVSVRVR